MSLKIESNNQINKRTICIMLFLISSIMLYPNASNTVSLICFLTIIALSCVDDYCLIMSIGCGNVLPSVMGLTMIPVVVIICLIKGVLRSKSLFLFSRKNGTLLLLIGVMFFVLLLSSIANADSLLFTSFVLNIVFMLVLTYYFIASRINVQAVLESFMVGLGIAIIIGILIQFNVWGFYSNHAFRLSIGERSDPNSSAFLCVMFLVQVLSNLIITNVSLKKTILYIALLFPGLLVLFATGSRGGALACVFGLLICLFFRVRYSYLKQKCTFAKNISICVLFLIIFLVLGNFFSEQWFNAVYSLFDRIGEKNDGARLTLLMQSVTLVSNQNPMLGIGLKAFKQATTHVPHNLFSDYLVGGGWIGLILFLFVCVCCIKSLTQLIKRTKRLDYVILLSLLIVALIDMATYSAYNEKILYLLFALVAYSNCQKPRRLSKI